MQCGTHNNKNAAHLSSPFIVHAILCTCRLSRRHNCITESAITKPLKVCTRFVLKNHLTAIYSYILAENSSTGFTSIHRGLCKMLWYCSILFYFESVLSIVNLRKENNRFTVLNLFFKALNNFRLELWFLFSWA